VRDAQNDDSGSSEYVPWAFLPPRDPFPSPVDHVHSPVGESLISDMFFCSLMSVAPTPPQFLAFEVREDRLF